jgi:hypothetical protein
MSRVIRMSGALGLAAAAVLSGCNDSYYEILNPSIQTVEKKDGSPNACAGIFVTNQLFSQAARYEGDDTRMTYLEKKFPVTLKNLALEFTQWVGGRSIGSGGAQLENRVSFGDTFSILISYAKNSVDPKTVSADFTVSFDVEVERVSPKKGSGTGESIDNHSPNWFGGAIPKISEKNAPCDTLYFYKIVGVDGTKSLSASQVAPTVVKSSARISPSAGVTVNEVQRELIAEFQRFSRRTDSAREQSVKSVIDSVSNAIANSVGTAGSVKVVRDQLRKEFAGNAVLERVPGLAEAVAEIIVK